MSVPNAETRMLVEHMDPMDIIEPIALIVGVIAATAVVYAIGAGIKSLSERRRERRGGGRHMR